MWVAVYEKFRTLAWINGALFLPCDFLSCYPIHDHNSHQLLEELYLVHEHGVRHGDLQASNVVLQNGFAHFIDFSHGYEHPCTGRATCSELIEARRFLLLNLECLDRDASVNSYHA